MDGNKFRDNGAAGEIRPERVHKRSNKCIKPNYSEISKKKENNHDSPYHCAHNCKCPRDSEHQMCVHVGGKEGIMLFEVSCM